MDENASETYYLANELLPNHEGDVKACCRTPVGGIVTAGNDRMLILWQNLDGLWVPAKHITDHAHNVVTLITMEANEISSVGGFVAAGLDNIIRIYDSNGVKLKELSGHEKGVISLCWGPTGHLISGSWDGNAKVWNILLGSCLETLESEENGVSCCSLPGGEIVTGTTGRKNQYDQHVDYKIRIWRNNVTTETLTDHTHAVRDVATFGDLGFVSVSNDGSIVLRTSTGEICQSMMNPLTAGGTPAFCFKVLVSNLDNAIITANEDCTVRIYRHGNLDQTIEVPGVPWCLSEMENGDLLIGCGHRKRSSIGHVYIFSRSKPESDSNSEVLSRFMEDMASATAKTEKSESGDEIPILGDYSNRTNIPGRKDQIARFRMEGHQVMICMYDESAGTWSDIGTEVVYDFVREVAVDSDTGINNLTLRFNRGDDPVMVATKFLMDNQLPADFQPQVVEMITNTLKEAPVEIATNEGIGKPTFRHFPFSGHIIFKTHPPFEKLMTKFAELTGDETQVDLFKPIIEVLKDTSHYHSRTIPKKQHETLLELLTIIPNESLFPVADVARIWVLHPSTHAILNSEPEFADKLMIRLCELLSVDVLALRMITLRMLCNIVGAISLEKVVERHLGNIIQACMDNCTSLLGAKKLSVPFVSLLKNLSVVCNNDTTKCELSRVFGASVLKVANEEALVFATIVSLGNLTVSSKAVRDLVSSNEFATCAIKIKTLIGMSERVMEAIQDLEKAISSV
eukprot:TRINITY_DN6116_c0_g1_i1.p1 TRINITY_DN6116_c0_g1~~TRINITY_DN6116_c0_g1_i1.p1  ORF type:complete len:741 (+),score=174.72 TRINITY_DN6116_c0_g1_i1:195-2417(+)